MYEKYICQIYMLFAIYIVITIIIISLFNLNLYHYLYYLEQYHPNSYIHHLSLPKYYYLYY